MADVKESQRAENQFRLLISRRFAPFFWTQFLGAFNDNVFKNFLILILAFQVAKADSGMSSNTLINIATGLFILPFFLFSALAGQMADKYEKSQLITYTKALEVFIMMAASGAFFFQSHATLLILLFFLGLQATLFGPVKYSIIPQHLTQGELVGGNAMVEMGTFVAILIGTITGGLLVQLPGHVYWLSGGVCLIAVAGFLTSLAIPHAAANAPNLNIGWNPVRETLRNIGFAREPKSVFLSILGISWFWFLGTSYLTQLPNYTKDILHGSEGVVTLLLTMFSIGIGIGSLLCERLSGHKVELGLVPFGSIGLTVFGLDLFWVHRTPIPTEGLMTLQQFMATPGSLRVLIDLVMIGIFGGFNIVPLYALVQLRTKTQNRARVIAANNILNAFFMVLASLLAISLIGLSGLTIPQYFLVLVLMNCCVAAYIYNVIPEFLMRFLIWMLTHTMYRVQHRNFHFIPDEGPAVIVCNHVSLVDGPLIAGACRRPIRFVIFEPIYRMPVLNFIFRTGKAIPIDSQQRNSEVYNRAFDLIAQALDEGELICIFPEGKMTSDGEIDFFRPGIEKIVNRSPVPVIPMALRGLWGSFFSNRGGYALTHRPRRFWSKVEIVAGLPVAPQEVTAHGLQEIVQELRGEYP